MASESHFASEEVMSEEMLDILAWIRDVAEKAPKLVAEVWAQMPCDIDGYPLTSYDDALEIYAMVTVCARREDGLMLLLANNRPYAEVSLDALNELRPKS